MLYAPQDMATYEHVAGTGPRAPAPVPPEAPAVPRKELSPPAALLKTFFYIDIVRRETRNMTWLAGGDPHEHGT